MELWAKMGLARSNILFRVHDISSIFSNSATLSNSTASLIIPPDFFAFKIYFCLFNSPGLRF